MNSTERVRATIIGQPIDRQPIYGWVSFNLGNEITARWGSVEAFEDKYEFDMAQSKFKSIHLGDEILEYFNG